MSSRGRRKPTGTSQVPRDPGPDPIPDVAVRKSAAEQTRAKVKVPVSRKTRVVVTPVEK